MKKVMFICSGNTCRSPLAEGLFKKYLADKNISDIEVSSAGVAVLPGDEVSINSAFAAMSRGVDISLHRAQRLNVEHLLNTDVFVCMSDSHEKTVRKYCDYKPIITLNVSDPYGSGQEVYEKCAVEIEEHFPEILEIVESAPTVKPMCDEHISSIAQLEKECFAEPWSEVSLREELENNTARFFSILKDDEVVGYIGANTVCGETYITNVAVKSSERGNHYGEMLVNHLILQCRLEKCAFVTLEVRESNNIAVKLYGKCGFVKVGERKNFYSQPQENALLYTYYLES